MLSAGQTCCNTYKISLNMLTDMVNQCAFLVIGTFYLGLFMYNVTIYIYYTLL